MASQPCPLQWIAFSPQVDVLPVNVVHGGVTIKGETTYIARCTADDYSNDKAAGAYIPSSKAASIPFGGGEKIMKSCDLLVCNDPNILFWSDGARGSIPDLAVGIGNTSTEEIYIARTRPGYKIHEARNYQGKKIQIQKSFEGPMLGKLHPSHRTMYLAHRGNEYFIYDYQVLCAYLPPAIELSVLSPYKWVAGSNGYIPDGGIIGGKTERDEAMYIGRTSHGMKDEFQPGFVVQSQKNMFYSWHGTEKKSSSYEVLVPTNPNDFTWHLASNFDHPKNALYVDEKQASGIGRTRVGSAHLFTGRTWDGKAISIPKDAHDQMQLVGSVHRTSKFLFVPYSGFEYLYDDYELLVVSLIPNSLQELCRYSVLCFTSGVPDRIKKLPLPEHLKSFCHMRNDETRRQ